MLVSASIVTRQLPTNNSSSSELEGAAGADSRVALATPRFGSGTPHSNSVFVAREASKATCTFSVGASAVSPSCRLPSPLLSSSSDSITFSATSSIQSPAPSFTVYLSTRSDLLIFRALVLDFRFRFVLEVPVPERDLRLTLPLSALFCVTTINCS